MNRAFAAMTLTLVLSTFAGCPAWAASSSKNTSSNVSLPTRLASFAVGSVVGAPICVVRKTAHLTCDAAKIWTGGRENPYLVVPARVLSVPIAAAYGFIEGPVYGAYYAWKYSADQPFSKATFSLSSDK